MQRVFLLLGLLSSAFAQVPAEPSSPTWKTFSFRILPGPISLKYSRRGFEASAQDGAHTARIMWRVQPRFSIPFEEDPRTASKFAVTENDNFSLRRARFKIEGQAFNGFVTYKFQRDLVMGEKSDLSMDLNFKPWLALRLGQFKSTFNQERLISSGRQQMAERSIVNREVTLDRQTGFAVIGRVGAGMRFDSMYSFEVLGGHGRNRDFYRDTAPLFVARYQWNFFGVDPGILAGDPTRRKKPAGMVAFAAARDRSRYTRQSSGGPGHVDGFSGGAPGQFKLLQFNAEANLKYRGLSLQTENHWKHVTDTAASRTRRLRGTYIMAGYFPHGLWKAVPGELEFAYRWAYIDANVATAGDLRRENTLAVNVYLENHENRITFEASRLSLAAQGNPSAMRYRVQYDVHF